MIWKLCEKKSTKKSVKTALVMIFTLFNLFKFVRVFYWRILLSHFCIFFGFITMWRYWNSFPLERETVCSCRFLSKLTRVKFKQTLKLWRKNKREDFIGYLSLFKWQLKNGLIRSCCWNLWGRWDFFNLMIREI